MVKRERDDPTLPSKSLFGSFGSYHRRCDRMCTQDESFERAKSLDKSNSWRSDFVPRTLTNRCNNLNDLSVQPRFVGFDKCNLRCVCGG
jgi:hypothetical protein